MYGQALRSYLLSPVRHRHVVDQPPVNSSDQPARENDTDGNKSSRRRPPPTSRDALHHSIKPNSPVVYMPTGTTRSMSQLCSCATYYMPSGGERAWRVQFSLQLLSSSLLINQTELNPIGLRPLLLVCHLQCPWLRARAPARSSKQTSLCRQARSPSRGARRRLACRSSASSPGPSGAALLGDTR